MANKKKSEDIIFPPLMTNEDPEKRISTLKATADKIDPEFYYLRKFTADELIEAKENLSEFMLMLSDLKERFDQVKTEFKEETKPIDTNIKSLVKQLKWKGTFVVEEVYIIHDHESQMAGIYNSRGEVIDARPLRPEEYQKTIKLHEGTTGNETSS